MTTAPTCLLQPRTLLLTNLDRHPGSTVNDDLESIELGIVGNEDHRGGYHCGKDRCPLTDYSVRESSRDRAGLTLDAAALDVGWFEIRIAGKAHNLRTFSIWCVAQCKAGKPDAQHIREIIYSPDGRVVRRYDRLGIRDDGDDSHLSHTHISLFRDAIKAGKDVLLSLFRRYLTEIGLLPGEDDDVQLTDKIDPDGKLAGYAQRTVQLAITDQVNERAVWWGEEDEIPKDHRPAPDAPIMQVIGLPGKVESLTMKVDELAGRPTVVLTDADRADIAAKVLAGLPAGFAAQVADELHARLAS